MSENVHPILEAVARAICSASNPGDPNFTDLHWRDYLPAARATLNALADGLWRRGYPGSADFLREIAAEPKPSVEKVVADHLIFWGRERMIWTCSCGWEGRDRVEHLAGALRDAGLVSG